MQPALLLLLLAVTATACGVCNWGGALVTEGGFVCQPNSNLMMVCTRSNAWEWTGVKCPSTAVEVLATEKLAAVPSDDGCQSCIWGAYGGSLGYMACIGPFYEVCTVNGWVPTVSCASFNVSVEAKEDQAFRLARLKG